MKLFFNTRTGAIIGLFVGMVATFLHIGLSWISHHRIMSAYFLAIDLVATVILVTIIAFLGRLHRQNLALNQELAEDRYKSIFEHTGTAMIIIESDFTISLANTEFNKLFGYNEKEVGGKLLDRFVAEQDRQMVRNYHLTRRVHPDVAPSNYECHMLDCLGRTKTVLITISMIPGTLQSVASMIDITERKKNEEDLKNYRQLFHQARDIILFIRMDGHILDANEAAVKAYGYTRDELLGRSINDLRLPGTEKAHHEQMLQAYQHGIELETIQKRKDGSTFSVEVSAVGIDVGGEQALISIVRDITDRIQAEREIRYLGFHDKLTGLHNRAYLENQLSGNLENVVPCSIIMGDLNGLKIANDAFGHKTGDKLLVEMAKILQESCRSVDIVARAGGDEFVILLPGVDEKVALSVVQRIKEKCAESTLEPISPSISLGLATRASLEQDIFEVLQEAETRMYRRKMLEADSARSFSIQSMQRMLHEKSNETEEHTERLRTLVRQLAQEMGLSSVSQDDLDLLAALHDIGKIAIPDEILNKPGKLTNEEWEIMKRHTEVGYRIAKTSPELASIAEYILAHHERWDGQGYPRGLAGEQIPLAARILAVVDAYDVMINERPYKRAFTSEMAIKEVKLHSGTQFDPGVVSAFLSLIGEEV